MAVQGGNNAGVNEKVEECKKKCDANPECHFLFVKIDRNFCVLHKACDKTRKTVHEGLTYKKQVEGKSFHTY